MSQRARHIALPTIDAVKLGEGWADGRGGYLWYRVDAALPGDIFLAVTWDDNSETEEMDEAVGSEWEQKFRLYDPRLELTRDVQDESGYRLDYEYVGRRLTIEQALALMAAPVDYVAKCYARTINRLRANRGRGEKDVDLPRSQSRGEHLAGKEDNCAH